MGLQVPICGVESLPDAVQIRFAIGSARRPIDVVLARCGYCAHLESGDHGGRSARKYCASPPISHVRLLSNPACPTGAAATTFRVSLRTSFDEPDVVAAGSLGTRLFAFSFVCF